MGEAVLAVAVRPQVQALSLFPGMGVPRPPCCMARAPTAVLLFLPDCFYIAAGWGDRRLFCDV